MAKVAEYYNSYEMTYQDYWKVCRRCKDGPSQEAQDDLDYLRGIIDKCRIEYGLYANRCVTAGKMPLSWIAWADVAEVGDDGISGVEDGATSDGEPSFLALLELTDEDD
jgi:hypothetical protein